MLTQRITISHQQPYNLQTYKPDDPTEKYIRANYMLQVINNIEAQKNKLTKEEMLTMLRQTVEDYTNEKGFVVITGESKPKPILTRIK